MGILAAIAFFGVAARPAVEPVLWLRPDGEITIQGRRYSPKFSPGTRVYRSQFGATYDFDGRRSGLLFGDVPALRLTQSMTVSVWLYLRSYVNDGPGAQILFRGDDRNGHDPYTLVIHSNGTVNFGVQTDEDKGMSVSAEIPLNSWTHVLGSIDAKTGQLKLYMNNELIGTTITSFRPFAQLVGNDAPGVGIGNVQNDQGPHNQPMNGQLADLRLYDGVFTPDELGIRWFAPRNPPLQ
ncbi:MAG: hypothetical protein BGO01_13655 [Armatimonadetes bacterium 55-13]|nr:LamG domain-containing protein [Armatimonadota bacterium]OJU64773.1 MAG: hypothetical protein BGO01_13655 [Armatimonadetes bacterium 55-13]